VGRLSLESTVSAARWQAEVQMESETPRALDLSATMSLPDREAVPADSSLSHRPKGLGVP
jgi:hypothetical protein